MGRDTTASIRMAAKRDRERTAGLRRLNVAVKPELFEKLALLVKQHNCTSQAKLIELLVEENSKVSESREKRGKRNAVTDKGSKAIQNASKRQQQETQKKIPSAKSLKSERNAATPTQMSLFES
ncbi:MAG: hypothetical protein PHF56_20615 [Desulfuromonadaceae bacterium]|nr:hypothetical protein [Desulfuromonadaceae bacterium]